MVAEGGESDMPIQMQKWERRDGVDRNDFALAVLDLCRHMRGSNPKIRSARFYWADPGNTVVMLTDGEPGWDDYNPEPNPETSAAMFRVADMGRLLDTENWADAGVGQRTWQRAGSPSGTP